MNDSEKKRKLQEIFENIETDYKRLEQKPEFKEILEKEKDWLCNLEDKLSQLTNENTEIRIVKPKIIRIVFFMIIYFIFWEKFLRVIVSNIRYRT